MSNDSKFFTNEKSSSIADRFSDIIKESKFFDVLVGYFYSSGFYSIYPSLENTKKIRVLIGISTSDQTLKIIKEGNNLLGKNIYNPSEVKSIVENEVEIEMAESEDTRIVEEGVQKFIEWIRDEKLDIRAYPSKNIHAKLYIMTLQDSHIDDGRVITGSSNFTRSGLESNLEFNVELKDSADYEFAKDKFEELWKDSVSVSEEYVETIENKTWFSDKIIPYHLYLKFLYEYFKAELSQTDEVVLPRVPNNFIKLEYQEQAVLNAKKILNEYGGVFISDVVGLGKTFITAMLAKQLQGRHLIIAPPVLLDRENPGSWRNAFEDFDVNGRFVSIGKLDSLLGGKADKYENIIIDEAHRMRNPDTATYEKLAEICRGKRVILVSATPYNNSPRDILGLVSLFQNPRKSTIPNLPNLDNFFSNLHNNIKKEDRFKDYESFIETAKSNAKSVRDNILKYLMVRRTRSDIKKYYTKDLQKKGLKFPKVVDPKPLYYQLSQRENEIFEQTIKLLANDLTYARYMPMTYYTGDDFNSSEIEGQRNLGRFMKILLVKRLESSFYAFKKSIARFIDAYEIFIKAVENGAVYTSKGFSSKILEFLDNDNEAGITKLIKDGNAQAFKTKDFKNSFISDLKKDKKILERIQKLWKEIDRDPKIEEFISNLRKDGVLNKSHLIIFTESKETAGYLYKKLNKIYPDEVICFDGSSRKIDKDEVIKNFDANAFKPENKFRILIATEVLSEGVNLHRSNVVINYDIPWNPTKLMQRIGRINRIDSKFEKIYTYNFFPSLEGDKAIALKEAAQAKIVAFIELLGADASLLTDGEEIASHSLFDRLNTIDDQDESDTESELKFLNVIKNIREEDPNLFSYIRNLPKKARTAKQTASNPNSFITYFRKGDIQKFFINFLKGDPQELNFMDTANILESTPKTKKEIINPDMFELLEENINAFNDVLKSNVNDVKKTGGNDSSTKLLKYLKATKKMSQQFTDEQVSYLAKVIEIVEERGLPKKTVTASLKSIRELDGDKGLPLKILNVLKTCIPDRLLKGHYVENNTRTNVKSEVVLSMYLKSK